MSISGHQGNNSGIAQATAAPLIERPQHDVPPQAYFVGSAIFHYLGPSFAVLLFARVDVLGVAWLRIASAALVFAVWRRPWRKLAALDRQGQLLIVSLGAVFAAMNACFYVSPIGLADAAHALGDPVAIAAGIGVGLSSSVIPYVFDQLAMARLPRATYALFVALLPATATVVGVVVLRQLPMAVDLAGIALVMAGVALHRQAA